LARVEQIKSEGVELILTHARPQGEKLKAEKGLNFPESDLRLGPLTDQELNKGPFVVEAIQVLDDLLPRMQASQMKKTALPRALQLWRGAA
jgi:hypothetical protein